MILLTKKEDKPINDEQTAEDKPEEEKPVKGMITLSSFKDTMNLSNMEYAGLKALLKAEDLDTFKESNLKQSLKKLRNESAFQL